MTNAATKQQQRAPAKASANVSVPAAPQHVPNDIFSISTDTFSTTNSAQASPLDGVKAWSVQRARQLRKDDFELYKQFHDFMFNRDTATARVIDSKTDAKREQVDSWVRGAIGAKTLACISARKESQQALLALLTVSAAFAKYGEKKLIQMYKVGEMDGLSSPRFRPAYMLSQQKQVLPQQQPIRQQLKQSKKPNQSKQQKSQPETRKAAPSDKKNAQSNKQENKQQAIKKVDTVDQQKKNALQALQKVGMLCPPPAPVTAKSTRTTKMTKGSAQTKSPSKSAAEVKKKSPVKVSQQTKYDTPLKNGCPVKYVAVAKNVSPLQSVPTMKDGSASWTSRLPIPIIQSRPAAIVSSAPVFSSGVISGNGYRPACTGMRGSTS